MNNLYRNKKKRPKMCPDDLIRISSIKKKHVLLISQTYSENKPEMYTKCITDLILTVHKSQ